MTMLAARANHLRTRRAHEHSRVTYVELTGATFSNLAWTAETVAAFVVAFGGSISTSAPSAAAA